MGINNALAHLNLGHGPSSTDPAAFEDFFSGDSSDLSSIIGIESVSEGDCATSWVNVGTAVSDLFPVPHGHEAEEPALQLSSGVTGNGSSLALRLANQMDIQRHKTLGRFHLRQREVEVNATQLEDIHYEVEKIRYDWNKFSLPGKDNSASSKQTLTVSA